MLELYLLFSNVNNYFAELDKVLNIGKYFLNVLWYSQCNEDKNNTFLSLICVVNFFSII